MSDESTDVEEVDAAPPDTQREELRDRLTELLGDAVVDTALQPHEDLYIRVRRDDWRATARALRDAGFTYFGFLSAIDWTIAPEGRYEDTEFDIGLDDEESSSDPEEGTGLAGGDTRFQLLVQLQDIVAHVGLLVKVDLDDEDPTIDTISDVFAGADWHEREAAEMFGISFTGHPNLQNIYLPTEFEGFPLRKDFPLLARQVKPWPGVVDIEEIPEHLEAQLEAEVMAAFEAEGGGQ